MIQRKCYSLFSPFVHFRRSNNVQKSPTAKGTIAFPSHSTHHLQAEHDLHNYIEHLINLPAKYQPVAVCMYFLDIQKGFHKIFLEHNIPVYTAGDWLDPKFTDRFYQVLKSFRYSTSNLIGSYVFYSVEMDIPFFLMGNEPLMKQVSTENVFNHSLIGKQELKQLSKVEALFSERHDNITPEQKELVEAELGIHTGVSRTKMCSLLYASLLRYYGKAIGRKILNKSRKKQ